MKFVEISASLGNDLKRYNVLQRVSRTYQPYTERIGVLYGVTKGTDIVQTNAPTNILIDYKDNPIDNSEPFYFGIRVYPFISALQDVTCNNKTISYGELFGLSEQDYFYSFMVNVSRTAILPDPYEGALYPQPQFDENFGDIHPYILNYRQAMQQFINDCDFPTMPNLDIPGQAISGIYGDSKNILYFSPEVCVLSELNQRAPRGVLNLIQDKKTDNKYEYQKYMVQFDGQNLNFKFGMAVNSDFAPFFTEPPNIYLPYLYRTLGGVLSNEKGSGRYRSASLGLVMQCLLYDSNGNVISA